MVRVFQVETPEHIRQAQDLLTEYFAFLRADIDKDYADFDDVPLLSGYEEELANLPGKYAPPDGRLLIAHFDGQPAGCVAFYKFGDGACEVKRLYTRPAFRGKKVGRALVERLVAEARQSGYKTILLSTVDVLKEAQALYASVGFVKTEPFFELPPEMLAHEIFMKLDLTPSG
jgi:GNAT superfamily N-acetyltransferase